MMHKLRRFYYQNKQKIWKVVLIIAFFLSIIYFFNKQIEINLKQQEKDAVSSNKEQIYEDDENKTYISEQSAINGETITEEVVKKVNQTVSKFLQHCKNGEIEKAYNMLSDECKKIEFDTVEKFKQKYLNARFSKDSIYEIQNWIKNTYKVTISEDILATGNANANQKQIEYITIVEESGESKLNVNSYIGKQYIRKEETQNNIKVTVISKDIYIDYEIYNFKIENLSNKTIKLDSLTKTNTMYLEDKNENKYNSYSHEILDEDLEIKAKRSADISIKYKNAYTDKREIKNIVFNNVILDYVEYKKSNNAENFTQKCNINVAI